MARDDFALLILSHGRAGNVRTIDTMIGCGYTGKWYIIIDNEDEQADMYYSIYGKEHVIMFDKYAKSLEVDTCDIPRKRNAVLYARETCFEVARELGLEYFLELDDDYVAYRMRFVDDNGVFTSLYVKDMDSIIDEVLDFMEVADIKTVAFAQTGDFIGGPGSNVFKNKLTRKAMNAFFCKVSRPFNFIGRMNDDVNAYVLGGTRGDLFFTIADISLEQQSTQQTSGGLTEMYKENGTYVKSFFSVMVAPSCVKIAEMGCTDRRIHHLVDWEKCAPKIISSRFRNG